MGLPDAPHPIRSGSRKSFRACGQQALVVLVVVVVVATPIEVGGDDNDRRLKQAALLKR